MLCPICNKPIINPTWKTCEKASCTEALNYAKRRLKKKPIIRLRKMETNREMVILMLWQGCSVQHICKYLQINKKEFDNILTNYKDARLQLIKKP